jgi:cell division septation protein DedD
VPLLRGRNFLAIGQYSRVKREDEDGSSRKEDRRDADRIVRDQIANELDERATRVDRVASGLAAKRELASLGSLNALSHELRLLATRVRTASYGYGGLFSNRDVNDLALDQIRQFDDVLLEGVSTLDAPIEALERATPETLGDAAAHAKAIVQHLSGQFDARSSVVETAEPSSVEPSLPPVTATLDKVEPVKPPPAYDLHDRDAVDILGDSFVVDARMEINGPEPFRLFRFVGDPKRWLMVPRNPNGPFALLDEMPAAETEATPESAGTEPPPGAVTTTGSVIGAGGDQRDLPVTYQYTSDELRQSLTLDWSGERQVFSGTPVHPGDIVIYGSTLT